MAQSGLPRPGRRRMLLGMTDLPPGLHGAFRRHELVAELGLSTVRMLTREGALVRFSRTVLMDRRRQLDLPTRSAAALLHVGGDAALTWHTAAAMYGCSAADAGTVHVLCGYHRKVPRRPGLALHQGLAAEQDVLELDGLRVLALDLVIAELLCTERGPTALALADQALAMLDDRFRGEFRAEVAHRIRTRADPRGRRRAGTLIELATGLPESPAESAMLLAIYEAGLPIPTPQLPIVDLAGHERYRLDFAWEKPKIALEYDGYAAHEHRGDADAARDADLASRGWLVLRASAADLRDPTRIIRALQAAFGTRRYAA
jgi:hypothetical protein